MPAYAEKYPVGSWVRIADRAALERFRLEWHLHNPLQADQVGFAGRCTTVREVTFYHGGDPLYVLHKTPGIWHEACLLPSVMDRELDSVVQVLDQYHQRATYGAVGGVVDRPPAFLMNGLPRCERYSWVVNAAAQLPTGYTEEQMHPALRERRRVITSPSELEEWLRDPS